MRRFSSLGVRRPCFNSSHNIQQPKTLVRCLFTLAFIIFLLTYASLCTWYWQILLPANIREFGFDSSFKNSIRDNYILAFSPSTKTGDLHCDVLKSMTRGKWLAKSYSEEEMNKLSHFINKSRALHNLPTSLERPDLRCGNVTFSHLDGMMHNLLWFRALCDPKGRNPCCYNNRCTPNISVHDCRCPECYDMRQQIHAEFSSWEPSDPNCKMKTYHSASDICDVLKNTTIFMIGDSFMRHIYIAMLSLLRKDSPHGPRRRDISSVHQNMCSEDFIYQHRCAFTVDIDTLVCQNTTKVTFLEHIAASQSQSILEVVRKLLGIPNSYLLLGIGIHDDFNFDIIAQLLLYPLQTIIKTFRWPEIIWISTHAPGLLKTPRVPSQSAESILRYNNQVKTLLQTDKTHIPILDFFQLTKGIMSFDGAHYGRGINEVKVQIFLNYISERTRRNT
ncbi:hypothetical protein PoB_007189000 [Plakobranchus ocellatus]|uniref:Uncharacterized protein n=1 Tax=Plakobranchus ocellatus TaxID=259542 RepID=A0AAV4DML4_9GAST|nr:hypothetical protein PoB_007189000 [Plakobranchus ocellatus]